MSMLGMSMLVYTWQTIENNCKFTNKSVTASSETKPLQLDCRPDKKGETFGCITQNANKTVTKVNARAVYIAKIA